MNIFLDTTTRKEFEKEASLLGAAGLGAAMHIAPNLAMKAMKSTETGERALAASMAVGLKHGREGKMLQPNARALIEYGVGPESMVDYTIGRRVGKTLGKYQGNPERQNVFLNRVKNKFGANNLNLLSEETTKKVNKVPVLGSFNRMISGDTNKKVEKILERFGVPESDVLTKKQKVGNLAMLGAAGAADPHLLLQPVLSAGRKAVAESSLGKRMLEKNFDAGLEGKMVSKTKERVIDTLVSPSVLDTRRVGNSIHSNFGEGVTKAVKGVKSGAVNMYEKNKERIKRPD